MLLRYTADRRTLAVVGLYFVLVLAALALPLSWVITPPLVVGLSVLSFVCAVITHNTVHTPIFYSRWLNRSTQVALTLTYGHPVSAFVPGHNLSHHRYTQTQRDLMRTSKVAFQWNLLNQLLFSWKVGPAIFASNLRFAARMRSQRPTWFRQLIVEAVVLVVLLALAVALDWRKAILYILVPHQYAAWGIMGINFVQHDGCDRLSPWNHSRNFTGRWINWITFNNGFHGIHHMHPSLHWSLLPEAHARELSPNIHPSLEQSNFLRYLFQAFIWPGRRTTFDGRAFEPPPAGEDLEWIPDDRRIDRADLGAAA